MDLMSYPGIFHNPQHYHLRINFGSKNIAFVIINVIKKLEKDGELRQYTMEERCNDNILLF